jgi:hypothetical protein
MARSKVKVSYQPAQRTPSAADRVAEFHKSYVPEPKIPRGLSPLTRYLEENADSGLSRQELVEQFREYDCGHPAMEVVASTSKQTIRICNDCGFSEKKFKPGQKDG